jgi:hypothetical protein
MTSDLIYALETDILKKIARLLAKGLTESADWQVKKLQELGYLNKSVIESIKEYRTAILSEIDTDIKTAGEKMASKIEASIPVGIEATGKPGETVSRIINTWAKIAKDDIVKSIATLARNAGPVYVSAINKASLAVSSGSGSLRPAVMQAIGEMADAGLPAFIDKADRTWSPEGYTAMVIRTTVGNVTNQVAFDIGDDYGTDLIEVSSHAGARPLCAPYQGKIFSKKGLDKNYPSLESTSYGEPAGIFGINCVLGDTLVSGPGKRVLYRRKYSGEIVVIRTAGGHELSVTPNHPILTDKGWVAAGLLTEGDNVISRAYLDRESGTSPNPNHDIARIEDIFNSFLESGNMFRLPGSSGYFHGDISDSDIEVILPKSLLRDGIKATILQHGTEDLFGFAPESPDSFASDSGLDQAIDRPYASPDGIMSGFSIVGAPSDSSPLLSNARCFGPATRERNAKDREVLPDRPFGNSDFSGDCVLPHAGIIHGEKFTRGNASLSLQVAFPVSEIGPDTAPFETVKNCLERASVFIPDLGCGNSGIVKFDNIVFIERKSSQSSFVHVYNLQTESGWYYANNIITHNCGHVPYPFFEGTSEKTYHPDDSEENAQQYKESQQQRLIEREIRAAKRKLDVVNVPDNAEKIAAAKQGVKDKQEKMRAFIAETDRTRRYAREQIPK